MEVTITATGYGGFGQVVATLPAGFSYEGSCLSDATVAVEGQSVAFTLLRDERFTHTVTAPSAEGSYSFSGALLDPSRAEQAIGGASTHQGRPGSYPPTPEPTPTATATSAPPTATPTPTPTAAPEPTPRRLPHHRLRRRNQRKARQKG